MLLDLEIKNFALVDHLVLEFCDGLTVLTGETGAGKSIILDSLSFLLGQTPKGMDSKSECRVAGRFQPPEAVLAYLADQGLQSDSEELLIVRERRAGGRTTSRLNGSLVSVQQLKELSGLLVDLHGQHQSYALTRPSSHLPMLDQVAGKKHLDALRKYRRDYQNYLELKREIVEIETAERDRLRQIEWTRLELEEIERVSPKPGEEVDLELEIKRRAASEDLANGTSQAVEALGGEGGVLDRLSEAIAGLRPLGRFDESLQLPLTRLETADIELQELSRELSEYAGDIDHDSSGLDKMQNRAEQLKTLCRKFGPTTEDVLKHAQSAQEKLERLENSEEILAELRARETSQKEKMQGLAHGLSRTRRKAAGKLGTELVAELASLAMPKVAFQVEFENLKEFGFDGLDRAQFLFSPNPGREPSPLAETASGGELSRVMLALVSILSRFQNQPTLIFDEIDVGLGGRTAESVANRLARLATKAQVLCVTHLPVVAAAGSGHLVVEKQAGDRSTTVSVKEVAQSDRVEELARMLSGGASQKRARELAAELLKQFSTVGSA